MIIIFDLFRKSKIIVKILEQSSNFDCKELIEHWIKITKKIYSNSKPNWNSVHEQVAKNTNTHSSDIINKYDRHASVMQIFNLNALEQHSKLCFVGPADTIK